MADVSPICYASRRLEERETWVHPERVLFSFGLIVSSFIKDHHSMGQCVIEN
jgi:hypothetical protein